MFSFAPKPAARVDASLIDECYANLECRVADTWMVAKYCDLLLKSSSMDRRYSEKFKIIHHLGRDILGLPMKK